MTNLPEPLTPPDCDLRGNEWMPLYGDRLFASDTWLMASAEGRCAALTLWWAAWKQSPAASLPDNDRALAQLAGYGMQVDAWMKVREEAMRCWIKCSDGRLYHPVLADFAIQAWGRRENARRRKADYRARQDKDRNGDIAGTTDNVPVSGIVRNGDERIGDERIGEERKGEEISKKVRRKRDSLPTVVDTEFALFWDAYPKKVDEPQARRAFTKAIKKTTIETMLEAIHRTQWSADPAYQKNPQGWLNGERWNSKSDPFDPVLRAAGLSPEDYDDPPEPLGGLLN